MVGRRTRQARPGDRPGAAEGTIRQRNKKTKAPDSFPGPFICKWSGRQDFILSQSKDRARDAIRHSVVSLIESLLTTGMIACAIRSWTKSHKQLKLKTCTKDEASPTVHNQGNPLSGRRLTSSGVQEKSSSAACLVRLTSDLPGERSSGPSPFPCLGQLTNVIYSRQVQRNGPSRSELTIRIFTRWPVQLGTQ